MENYKQNNEPLENFLMEKAYLENKKIELEINQLNQSYFKKSILPTLIQVAITSIIALTSVYFAYKNILTDAKEKNIATIEKSIDVKLKSNQTLLETIELTRKRNLLDKEVSNFEITKGRLLNDSVLISNRLDSMSQGIIELQNERVSLQRNIVNLSNTKRELVNELGFATINHNLQELRKYPGPNYTITQDLINVLSSDNPFKQRTFDSLLLYTKDENIKYISLFILYNGTLQSKYRNNLFAEIPLVLNQLTKDKMCLSGDFKNILVHNSWTVQDKAELVRILLGHYKNEMTMCGRLNILDVISKFGFDPNFSFSRTNYSLYWDYLKINRDIFTSSDTTLYEDDRYSVLTNIIMYCPQLYYALLVKYLGYTDQKDFVTLSANYAILKSLTSLSYFPIHKQDYIAEFGKQNELASKTADIKQYYTRYYNEKREKIDRWIYGNFELFRTDTSILFSCFENKTF
ncbi:MAG: hypothetical protein U0T56_09425 [Ferruginibacter sp.]